MADEKDTPILKENYGSLTEDQFQKLKNKHGKLMRIDVAPGEGESFPIDFWFKKPDMRTLGAASKFFQSNPIQAAQIFAKNCLVHGDAKLLDDPEIFMAISPSINNLIAERAVVVKNY